MEALVMMLKNKKENRFHPIMYFESPFPGGEQSPGNQNLIRYKSKGHHTIGFTDRAEAVKHVEESIVQRLNDMGYNANLELEKDDIEWDGIDMPIDIQIRSKKVTA